MVFPTYGFYLSRAFLLEGTFYMVKGVEIKVRADAKQARTEIARVGQSIDNIGKQAEQLKSTFQKLAVGITAAFAGFTGGGAIVRAADQMAGFRNRINLVTKDAGKTQKVLDDLFKVAARSRTDIGLAADTFNRFGLALADSNKPVEELLKVTEAVSKASIISGASAESAKAALVQLGQGLSSGELRGEELNSVLEQTPRLARTIAKGMKIPFGELRSAAKAGQLTAEEVYAAILSGAEELDAEFKLMQSTVGDLSTVFKSELTRTIANFDEALGFTANLKTKITIATDAVRFMGEEVKIRSIQIKTQFAILLSNIRFFVDDVHMFLKDLFTVDLDPQELVNSVTGAFTDAKEFVKKQAEEKAGMALSFTVEKLNLAEGFILGDEGVLAGLKTFSDNVIGFFEGMWTAIVGNTWWPAIFDPTREKKGGKAVGNSSHWSKFLTATVKVITTFTTGVVTAFNEVYNGVTGLWKSIMGEIEGVDTTEAQQDFDDFKLRVDIFFQDVNKIVSEGWEAIKTYFKEAVADISAEDFKFKDAGVDTFKESFNGKVDEMFTKYGEFTKYLDEEELTIGEAAKLAITTEWDKTVLTLTNRWDSAKAHIEANGFALSPEQDQAIQDQFDKTMLAVEERFNNSALFLNAKTGTEIPMFNEIETSMETNIQKAKDLFNAFKGVIEKSIIGTTISIVLDEASKKIDVGEDMVNDTIKAIENNTDRMVFSLGAAFTAAAALGFQPMKIAKLVGGGILLAFSPEILNSGAFQESLRSVSQGAGETLNSLLLSETPLDPGAGLVAGLLESLGTVSAAFAGGLFGTEFESELSKNLFSILTIVIAGIALSGTLRGKFMIAGSNIAGTMFNKQVGKVMNTKLANVVGVAAINLKNSSAVGKMTAAGEKLGGALFNGFAAYSFADVFIPDDLGKDATGISNLGDNLSAAIGGAFAGAQIGAMFGPVGAIGAAIVGALGSVLASIFLDPQQIAEIKAFWAESVTEPLSEFWDSLTINPFADWKLPQAVTDFFDKYIKGDKFKDDPDTVLGATVQGGGFFSSAFDQPRMEAEGGPVFGAGTATSDSIPAMLSNGEYVIKTSAAQKIGYGALDKLNRGIVPKFNTGGAVGTIIQGFSGGKKVTRAQQQADVIAQAIEDLLAQREIARERANTGNIVGIKEFHRINKRLEELHAVSEKQLASIDEGNATAEDVAASAAAAGGGSAGDDVETVGQQYADGLRNAFNNGLAEAIKDGDFKGFGMSMLDQVTGSIMDAGIQGFTSALTGSLFGDEGIDSFFDNIFGSGEKAGGKSGGIIKSLFGGGDEEADPKQSGEELSAPFEGVFSGFGEKFKGILDGFGGNFKGILGGLGQSLGGLLGGSSGGIGQMLSGFAGGSGLGGSIAKLGMSFLGFNQGGTVPATPYSQAGKDSVPAMLTPGEVVLSRKQLGGMTGMAEQATQSFNINVQGDVSRQTRKEIVKMMPEIAGGVNKTNKENNYRR